MNVSNVSTFGESQQPVREVLASRVRKAALAIGVSSSGLAARLGLASSSVSNYWTGKRAWPVELLPQLAVELRTNVSWLIGGESEEIAADLVPISEIDLAYGLGGTFSDGPVETQVLHFPRLWLESITRSPPAQLTFARGRGDSMLPTLLWRYRADRSFSAHSTREGRCVGADRR